MKRCAVLLSCSSDKQEAASSGAALLGRFLLSGLGGSWDECEIVATRVHSISDVAAAISVARASDVSLVYVHGRGEIGQFDRPWSEARFHLASDEIITERDFNPGTPRCCLILDTFGTGAGVGASDTLIYVQPSEWSRNAFDAAMGATELGLVAVRAARRQPFSEEAFVNHVVTAAMTWAKDHGGVLRYRDAIRLATETCKDIVEGDTIEYRGGRRLIDFPFAVHE